MLRLAAIATRTVVLVVIVNVTHAWPQASSIILAGGRRLRIGAGVHLIARSSHPTAHTMVGHYGAGLSTEHITFKHTYPPLLSTLSMQSWGKSPWRHLCGVREIPCQLGLISPAAANS